MAEAKFLKHNLGGRRTLEVMDSKSSTENESQY